MAFNRYSFLNCLMTCSNSGEVEEPFSSNDAEVTQQNEIKTLH